MKPLKHENEPLPPILALDLGQKTVGVAISDDLAITIKRLDPIRRTSWKNLLKNVGALIERFDARTLVIGLPLSLDGTRGVAAETTHQLSLNFARSLKIPVYLQDERLTSEEARRSLREHGYNQTEVDALIDSESAAIILRDFLNSREERFLVNPN
ncbi:MAG TPA: Holliday junction resolvase RuvX [Pyrinomonadaceae bacterium]|nr:Holliday junction resolvase RuvX [Pyrinomonadaceae bacterium]